MWLRAFLRNLHKDALNTVGRSEEALNTPAYSDLARTPGSNVLKYVRLHSRRWLALEDDDDVDGRRREQTGAREGEREPVFS